MNPGDQRRVLVTGGTGALGQALVPDLVRAGYAVVVTYRNRHDLESLQRVGLRDAVEGVAVDLLDEGAVRSAFGAIPSPIWGFVHLVGGFTLGKIADTDLATWRGMVSLNVETLAVAARAILPRLLEAGEGRIITVGSSGVGQAMAELGAYTLAKEGVVSFTRTLANELRGTGITANTILPATMDTPNNAAVPAEQRVALPKVTAVIMFLLSPEASGVTGAQIPITVPGV